VVVATAGVRANGLFAALWYVEGGRACKSNELLIGENAKMEGRTSSRFNKKNQSPHHSSRKFAARLCQTRKEYKLNQRIEGVYVA